LNGGEPGGDGVGDDAESVSGGAADRRQTVVGIQRRPGAMSSGHGDDFGGDEHDGFRHHLDRQLKRILQQKSVTAAILHSVHSHLVRFFQMTIVCKLRFAAEEYTNSY
jgi:hypothetical protein